MAIDVFVDQVVDQPAARRVALDAHTAGGVVFNQAVDQQVGDARIRLAADGHAVAAVEVVVDHAHVRCAGFDGDVIVAVIDPGFGHSDVGR